MKKEILEEINRMRVLGGILNEAPNPTSIIPMLIAKFARTSLDDTILTAFESLEKRGVITIDNAAKTLTKVEWVRLTDDELKLLFTAQPLRDALKEVTTAAGVDITSSAQKITFKGNFKRIVKGYDDAAGSVISGGGSSAAPGSTTLGKSATTFGGGNGLNVLPANSSIDEVMKHIDVDPIFSQIMKSKKGSREMVQNWIEVNLGDNVSVDEILKKVDPYFERLVKSPDQKTVTFSRKVDKVIEMAKKGDAVWQGSKGTVKWGLGLGLIGVVVGAWTLKDFAATWLCKLGWEKSNDFFGCNGGETNNTIPEKNNDIDWSKYKPQSN